VARALAAGCTAVVTPTAQTSLTAIILADILEEVGLPARVYNIVTGHGREAGAALVTHPHVAHVTFTGSIPTGQDVMRRAADHVASVTLELGGKSPVAVLADANLDAAVEGTLNAIYMNAGQVCSAASRLIVELKLHSAMLERPVSRTETLTLGHGLDDPLMGPLISDRQLRVVAEFVEDARRNDGLKVAAGGKAVEIAGMEGGHFYAPTIIDEVPPDARVAQEEIFGPVLSVQVVGSPEEAIAISNSTEFGLVAGIYTSNHTCPRLRAKSMRARSSSTSISPAAYRPTAELR